MTRRRNKKKTAGQKVKRAKKEKKEKRRNQRKRKRKMRINKNKQGQKIQNTNKSRVFGQSTSQLETENLNRYESVQKIIKFLFLLRFPWLCSLKGPGFTGQHRCGVTLLSGQNFYFLEKMENYNFIF